MPTAIVRDRQEWAADVAAALAALPTTQSDALRLLYFEHLTDFQIAVRMDLTIGRARSATADGLRHLGQTLSRRPTRPD